MVSIVYSVVGFAGAFAVLFAYFQVSRQKWEGQSRAFQVTNVLGAAMLIAYGLYIAAWPNVLLNAVWLGVGVLALHNFRKR